MILRVRFDRFKSNLNFFNQLFFGGKEKLQKKPRLRGGRGSALSQKPACESPIWPTVFASRKCVGWEPSSMTAPVRLRHDFVEQFHIQIFADDFCKSFVIFLLFGAEIVCRFNRQQFQTVNFRELTKISMCCIMRRVTIVLVANRKNLILWSSKRPSRKRQRSFSKGGNFSWRFLFC